MLHALRHWLNRRRRLAPAWWVSLALALVHGALDVLAYPKIWRMRRVDQAIREARLDEHSSNT